MHRSKAKPRSEKSKYTASAQKTQPPNVEVKSIIAGCFNRDQWKDFLKHENADETVAEIMEELLSKVMRGCLQKHANRQLVPFSLTWAKDYFMKTVELLMLYLDEGEGPERGIQTEDSEPMPSACGAWSGYVQLAPQQEVGFGKIQAPDVNQECNVLAITASAKTPCEKETSSQKTFMKTLRVCGHCPSPKVHQKEEQQINVVPKPLSGRPIASLSRSTSIVVDVEIENKKRRHVTNYRKPKPKKPSEQSTLEESYEKPKVGQKEKQQVNSSSKSPPGSSVSPLPKSTEKRGVEVENENKNRKNVLNQKPGSLNQHQVLKPIPKLDPSYLPRNSVLPKYEILDISMKPNYKRPRGLSILEEKHKKKSEWTVTSLNPITITKGKSDMKLPHSRYSLEGMVS